MAALVVAARFAEVAVNEMARQTRAAWSWTGGVTPNHHCWRRMSHPDLGTELLRLGESRFVAHRRKELACFCERSVGA
jgi:hypothetical protein